MANWPMCSEPIGDRRKTRIGSTGGVQFELSEPVAVLLDETSELISLASSGGLRCFTSTAAFKAYVGRLGKGDANLAAE